MLKVKKCKLCIAVFVFGAILSVCAIYRLKMFGWSIEPIMQDGILEYRSLPEEIEDVLVNYGTLKDVVAQADVRLPIPQEMIPQGITVFDKYFVVSAYVGKSNSKCYVIDMSGELTNVVTLDISSHVGGISYDQKRGLIWLPDDDASLKAYDAESFVQQSEVKALFSFEKVGQKLKERPYKNRDYIDYLCVDGDYIFVGGFTLNDGGLVKKYKISDENDEIELVFVNSFKVPNKIQGMTFYHKDDETYLVLSQSFGRKNSSYILIFDYDEKQQKYGERDSRLSIEMPPLLEQITVFGRGLYVIFESGATKYASSLYKMEHICVLDIEKIIGKMNKKNN